MSEKQGNLDKVGSFIRDTYNEAREETQNRWMEEGAFLQKEEDLSRAIMGFLELKASDAQIYDLLEKYFSVDSIADARKYINDAKNTLTINRVREYLKAQNNGKWEISYGVILNNLHHKLEKEPKYQLMDPEKIIKTLK